MLERFLLWYLVAVALICLLVLVGCTSQPSCYETPRNMRCMSGPQLERELAIKRDA